MHVSGRFEQPSHPYGWRHSYAGLHGIVMAAVGIAALISGAVLPGSFFLVLGATVLAYGHRRHRQRTTQ